MANDKNGLKVTTLEDVIAAVQGGGGIQSKYNFMLDDQPIKISKETGLEGVRYTVPKSAVYDRLSDGTYIPKFENFKGAEGNEDRLARQQSSWEQALHGVTKNLIKAGSYALDATVGTAYGIFSSIKEGDWDEMWNNEISNSLDDFNKQLDNNLVNYYTEEERQRGLLAAIPGFGATNFWFNDVGNGLAFVGGVLLPEVAIGVLSGGTSVGVGAGKIGFKFGKGLGRTVAKETAEATAKQGAKGTLGTLKSISGYNNYKKGAEVMRKYQTAIYGKKFGDVVGTGMFLARSSNFEAGMEARHNFHDAIGTYFRDFEDKNGRLPSYEEASNFIKDAQTAANGVYVANLAILSVSNAVMFSNKFNIGVQTGKKTRNFGNRFIGLGVKSTPGGKAVFKEATRGQKILGNSYFILGKPITEGIYEEGFQGVAGRTMQNWLDAKYNPEVESAYNIWSSLTDAFAEQYSSADGWKEMGIGMIIGSLGGTMQGQGIPGVKNNSRKSREKQIKSEVESMNAGRDNLIASLNQATGMSNFGKLVDSKSENMQTTSVENSVLNKEFIESQERVKSRREIRDDYDAIVDGMQLTDSQIDIIGEDNIGAYKTSLKESFKEDMKAHSFAKKAVAALGLDRQYISQHKKRGVRNTEGNLMEIQDALVQNIMIGKGALQGAKSAAQQISDLTGIDGVFSILEHYNNLTEKQKENVKVRKVKQKNLDELKERALKYQNNLAGIQVGRRFKDSTNNERALKASQEVVLIQEAIRNLENEIESIDKSLDESAKAQNFNLEGAVNIDQAQSIEDVIESLDNLDLFVDSLKNSGRSQDAMLLSSLLDEYKMYSDAHRGMVENYHRMKDTNFFSSKEGKGLINSILGSEYNMSDEFREILEKNDKFIDDSLKKIGINRGESVAKYMEKVLEKNENLSDREKYRIESIIRLQLGYEAIGKKIDQLAEDTRFNSSAKEMSPSPLEGDTVALINKLDSKTKDLSNVQVLESLISDILSELDRFKLGKVDQPAIDALERQLKELEAERDAFDKEGLKNKESEIKNSIKEEKAKETPDEEVIKTFEQELEQVQSELKNDIDSRIKDVSEELENTKRRKSIKIVKSHEYIRLNELNKKKVEEGLTEDEQLELDELAEDVDQWITISGIITEDLRLSDLIEQLNVLKNTEISEVEKVSMSSSEDVIDSVHIPDKTGRVYYNLAQTYDSVTATMNPKEGKVEISGMTWRAFIEEAGIPIEKIELDKSGEKPIGGVITLDKQGNILITPEDVEAINDIGNILILPTSEGLTTNYSTVLKHTKNDDGTSTITPLKSNFNQDFKENRAKGRSKEAYRLTPMDSNAVYDMQVGDEVTLEVSPADEYNQKLLNAYKKANASKSKNKAASVEKAIKELQDGLVIRVVTKSGKFVGVLKGKRSTGVVSEDLAANFEGLRDSIVNDKDFIDGLINIGRKAKVQIPGTITVNNVLTGFPTFNFKKTVDGVAVESRPLSDQDINKVVDIGYIEGGVQNTQSGKKDANTTFLNKTIENAKPNTKIPFIVVQKGNMRIALPVKIDPNRKEGLEEFERIYNSEASVIDKAVALNKFMASRGVDITKPGNSFVGVGANHNVTDEFFNIKLAELEGIEYYRDLKSWADPKKDMATLLKDGVTVDVDVHNPVHSPKVSLDFSKLNIDKTTVKTPNAATTNTKTTNSRVQNLNQSIKNAKDKDC